LKSEITHPPEDSVRDDAPNERCKRIRGEPIPPTENGITSKGRG